MNVVNSASTSTLSLKIEGMTCASCVARVQKAIEKVEGVQQASVNLATESAQIALEPRSAQLIPQIVHNIEHSGFEVRPWGKLQFRITGMTCASCVARVEKALLKHNAVKSASVNLTTEQAQVILWHEIHPDEIIQMITRTGFEAALIQQQEQPKLPDKNAEAQHLKRDFIVALSLSLPIFIVEMGSHVIPPMHQWVMAIMSHQTNWILQFILATLVISLPGRSFFSKGLSALWRLHPDMNSLVSVGSGAAYLYSIVATFFPQLLPADAVHVYYEPATLIISFILLGRYLEARAKGRTSSAIRHLIGIQPKTARILDAQGQSHEISIEDVQSDMLVAIRPGEKIPVDGVVMDGQSYVNESMISGESKPVAKSIHDQVIGGTINENGFLKIQATSVGKDAVLAQIIKMVEQAQAKKLPIQSLIDQVTLWFVPTILAIAALTFLGWYMWGPEPTLSYALINAVAVLIIACPCAMGLATPTSIMVATGRAAELGILFRHGDALQKLKELKGIAFDKTGTLTIGQPTLTKLVVAADMNETQVLQYIASLEQHSEHPIAKAVMRYTEEQGVQLLEVQHFNTLTGYGIEADVDQHHIHIGSIDLMKELGMDVENIQSALQDTDPQTPVFVAIDHQYTGYFYISDPIKPEAQHTLEQLKNLGLRLVMITGDHQTTAQHVAQQLGMTEVVAQVKPEQKAETVKSLQERLGKIAFVGDGINDAPALAQADVGIAIGTGTDVAIETADIVLMSGHLQGIQRAVDLSHKTMLNIKQNLFWAFIYNTALIPVAAGMLYPIWGYLLSPVFAAIAMALSSIFVLSNALRLKRFAATHDKAA